MKEWIGQSLSSTLHIADDRSRRATSAVEASVAVSLERHLGVTGVMWLVKRYWQGHLIQFRFLGLEIKFIWHQPSTSEDFSVMDKFRRIHAGLYIKLSAPSKPTIT